MIPLKAEKVIPKTFCYYFSVRSGTLVAAVVMLIVTVAFIIKLSIDAATIRKDALRLSDTSKHYCYVVTGIFLCVFMLLVNVWLIWGVCRNLAYVILSSCVAQALFLVYILVETLVMLLIFKATVDFVKWIFAIVFYFFFFVVMVYLTLVIVGHWRHLKRRESEVKT